MTIKYARWNNDEKIFNYDLRSPGNVIRFKSNVTVVDGLLTVILILIVRKLHDIGL